MAEVLTESQTVVVERTVDAPAVGGDMGRILACEFVAVAFLVLMGPGSAILIPNDVPAKLLMVSLSFGLAIMLAVNATSSIGGAHVNPAVSFGFMLSRKITVKDAIYRWIGQFAGGIFGAAIVFGIASGKDGFVRGNFASNGWDRVFATGGSRYGLGSAMVVEIVFTAVLVVVALSTLHRRFPTGVGGLTVGLTVAVIHMVTIPVDNTSVNPARSLATAIFADGSTDALKQVWAFIVFPMIGAIVGVIVYLMIDDTRLEDTMFDTEVLRDVRDAADDLVD